MTGWAVSQPTGQKYGVRMGRFHSINLKRRGTGRGYPLMQTHSAEGSSPQDGCLLARDSQSGSQEVSANILRKKRPLQTLLPEHTDLNIAFGRWALSLV